MSNLIRNEEIVLFFKPLRNAMNNPINEGRVPCLWAVLDSFYYSPEPWAKRLFVFSHFVIFNTLISKGTGLTSV